MGTFGKFILVCVIFTIIYNIYYWTMGPGKTASSGSAGSSPSSSSSAASSVPVMSSTGGGLLAAPAAPAAPVVMPVAPPAPTGPVYKGCYVDSPNRVLTTSPPTVMTVQQCADAAKAAGTNVFGMQFWEGSGGNIANNAQCWYTPNTLNPNYAAQGSANTCDLGTDGNYLGEAYTNAVYQF